MFGKDPRGGGLAIAPKREAFSLCGLEEKKIFFTKTWSNQHPLSDKIDKIIQ
jgi:hypothetical protein